MTNEEKQKAINALKKSVPIMAMTPNEFADYIKTLNKMADWLEQESKKAHWIDNSDGGRICNPPWDRYICSNCGRHSDLENYCCNCGAEMEDEIEK